MGLLTQALAGAVAGGAQGASEEIKRQDTVNAQAELQRSQQQHQENLVRLKSSLDTQNEDSGVVDENGARLSKSQYNALPDKSKVQQGEVSKTEAILDAKNRLTPKGYDPQTFAPIYPDDPTPAGMISTIQMEQQKNDASISHLNAQTEAEKGRSEMWKNKTFGGVKQQFYQDQIDKGVSEEEAFAKTQAKYGDGPNSPATKITEANQRKIDDMEEKAERAYTTGNKKAGDDIIESRNNYAKRYGILPNTYIEDSPATFKNKDFTDSTQVIDKRGSGHFKDLAPIQKTSSDSGSIDNNPLNLTDPSSGQVRKFTNAQDGYKANLSQLQKYGEDGKDTISSIINSWAPDTENDTETYIKNVSKWTGWAPNQKIDMNDRAQVATLMMAMARQEKGPDKAKAYFSGLNTQSSSAPPQAVDYLKAHPETADQFKAKFGYLPDQG